MKEEIVFLKRYLHALLATLALSFIATILVFGHQPWTAQLAAFFLLALVGWPACGFFGWALIMGFVSSRWWPSKEDRMALNAALWLGPLAFYLSAKIVLTGRP